jgi:hypothetical protein
MPLIHQMGDDSMPMQDMAMAPMYFHSSPTKDLILLFGDWRPKDALGYAVSLAVLFLLATVSEWLTHRAPSLLRGALAPQATPAELAASAEAPEDPALRAGGTAYFAAKFWLAAMRFALHFLLMLAVMSFDIGVFVVIVLGLSLGYARFASNADDPSMEMQLTNSKA